MTIDTYSHVIPGLQEMAAQRIENIIGDEAMEVLGVEKIGESMLAKCRQKRWQMLAKRVGLNVSRTGIEPVTC